MRFRPAAAFLVLALGGGIASALLSPPFAAPDEAPHFNRAYQLSQGQLHPVKVGQKVGGFLPEQVARDVDLLDKPLHPPLHRFLGRAAPHQARVFVEFTNTSIYPPLEYAPQVIGIWLGRLFHARTLTLLYAARLANLFAYVGLIWISSRWYPGNRTLPLACALVPTALFEASSASSDGATIALSFAVTAAAMGAMQNSDGGRSARLAAVSFVLAAFIGLAKPPYFLLALLFLAAAWRASGERRLFWLGPPALALLLAGLWSRVSSKYYVPYKGLADPNRDVRPKAQESRLLHAPWRLPAVLAHTITSDASFIARQFAGEFGRARGDLGWPAAAVVIAILLVVSQLPGWRPSLAMRAWLAAVAGGTFLAALTLVYIYNSAVGHPTVQNVYGRYLSPLSFAFLASVANLRGQRPAAAR